MKKVIILFILLSLPLFSDIPTMRISPFSLLLPNVGTIELRKGSIEYSHLHTNSAVRIDINESSPKKRWKLYARMNHSLFMPSSQSKSTEDLHWKFNEDPPNQYQSFSTADTLITENRFGKSETIKLDLAAIAKWSDPVGTYDTDIVFTLQWDD